MSTQSHDCQSCEERLVEFVCGDLSPEEARSLRTSVGGCAECSASLRRLEDGMHWACEMPIVEPPPSLDEAILKAAASRLPASSMASGAAPSRWSRLGDIIRAALTGPQLAMVTVALLVVAVGLWVVPGDPDDYATMAEPMLTQDPEGAHAPLSTPASPGAASASLDEANEALDAEATDSVEEKSALAEVDRSSIRGLRSEALAEAPRIATKTAKRAEGPPADSIGKSAKRSRRMAPGEVVDPIGPEAMPAPNRSAPSRYAAGGASASSEPGVERQLKRPLNAPVDSMPLQAQKQEADDPAQALHEKAKSFLAQGQCARSVELYRRLLTTYPGYSRAPQAIVEASDCYRRLGRYDEARAHLQQAMTYRVARRQAEQRLQSLESEMRSARKSPARKPTGSSDADTAAAAEAQ